MVIVNTEDYRTDILELFANQPNGVSLADCAVMVTAKKFDTKLIFGFDEVFRKNDYIRLGVDDKNTQIDEQVA